MKKIKEKRDEKLTANVTKTLKQEVLDFIEDNNGISESKATEILIIRGLRNMKK